MLYQLYTMNHAAVAPLRATINLQKSWLEQAWNPLGQTPVARVFTAGANIFERLTRRYRKPEFDLVETVVDGETIGITETHPFTLPFCRLKHFVRNVEATPTVHLPKLLIIAPLSGHYATLLKGTVAAMLGKHDVYITDWQDARNVPLALGGFDLADYIDYIVQFIKFLGPNTHVLAVCQPGPAVLCATSLLAEDDDPDQPASMIFIGSPIDTRESPTAPNRLATEKPLSWFKNNVIVQVPFPERGFLRRVYPGFLQLAGFMQMNIDRHIDAHKRLFYDLVKGDGDSVQAHEIFYDEYLAVMDLPANYYLETIDKVFQRQLLARGEMTHRGRKIQPGAIKNTALMTVEGELDDISGIGQTQAAHALCRNIPSHMQVDYVQAGVGHYGVFNGSRWRADIAPRITEFIAAHHRH